MTANPLLATGDTPPDYQAILPEHVVPAVQQRVEEARAKVEELTSGSVAPTWSDLIEPLDAAVEAVERAWGPVSHLNAVLGQEPMRAAHREAEPLIAEFAAGLLQDERLYKATKRVLDEGADLDDAQRHVLEDSLRDFRLAGVDLPADKKARYTELQVEMSQLSTRFSDNTIDSTSAFRLVVEDPADLEGLPQSSIDAARQQALSDDAEAPAERWTFTLHMPSYLPFAQYSARRPLREQMYKAYVTRATDGERDNGPLILRVLELRREMCALLGIATYADYSLATKMAESPAQVHGFLTDLAEKSLPFGRRDRDALAAFAKTDGVEELQAWDVAYYREKLRQERYAFSDDEVRQYFPLERVLDGLFDTLHKLYGIQLERADPEQLGWKLWHPTVRVLKVSDADGELRGHLMLDLFARDGKRQGAWMDSALDRRLRGGHLQRPIAYVVGNFASPIGDAPSLLRHGEVITLFHETGHALHHVLTQVSYRQCSGINNVPWDGVELPSQFHENWGWQAESLTQLSSHVETGQPLPQELLDKMLAAKNFMSGADMLRQVELALFDFELHMGFDPAGEQTVHDLLLDVRRRVSVFAKPDYERFENCFGHIFAGGYAAGYYSYKWAEVLAADAFSRFEEEGIYSPQAGRDFLHHVLEQGGSRDLMELYVAFRGRQPSPEALLRHSGLVAE
jgi:oligopeptidase A